MIKAVIFDMDGLMVDTEMNSYKGYRDFLKRYGITLTKEEYASTYPGKPLSVAIETFNSTYGLSCDIEESMQAFYELEQYYATKDGIQPKKGLYNLLNYLKENNYKTSVATSSHKDRALKLVGMVNVTRYFDEFTCGNEVTNGKPAPDIFLKACEKLGVEPSEALVLEDSESGIEAAYNGNIKVICIPDLKRPRDDIASKTTAILDSLDDVIDFLKNQ